ncbi:MAG TPA: hypothetical protein EYH32_06145 [Anaerolineae bacterium]|nr:hypothetical protein [Anaerolineae bacterium]
MVEKTTAQTRVRNALGVSWRGLVVGLGYTLATMVGGMVAQAVGLPLPEMASRVDPAQSLGAIFLSGVVIGLTLGSLSARLTLPTAQRAGLLFMVIFVLNSLINVVEALFFTAIPAAEQVYGLVTSAIGHIGLAVPLALLFRPTSVERRLLTALRETLGQRRWTSWAWRFGLAGLLYVPTYFFFGFLIYPIVRPYYEDPALGLRLAVPGFEVILPLEVGRGLLFVLTVFPLIAVLRRSRWSLAFWLGMTIAVLGAVTPMLQVSWFPLTMRVVHGLEITADSIVHGLVIAGFLGMGVAGTGARSAMRGDDNWTTASS